jgi:diaminohydroxyphosphoribosylaminopyrimidine deaminase/5-amino-6-(5-phosphoribosylamino)uracil reductase
VSLTSADRAYLRRALFVAERGRGTTSPNPTVGAVVVNDEDIVVAQGAHRVAGGPHAEVVALDAAGIAARGATLFCTLEPCSHTGRTGPCCERVAAAGIRRVVVAIGDPNPAVAGRGFAYLAQHGVEVVRADTDGAADIVEAARAANAPFLTWIARRRPHVTLKMAVSADGFVGGSGGALKLTGAAIDRVMHRQRAEVDAIAVGSTTVLVDDPQLTARLVYRARPLVRVLFDRRGRLTGRERVFTTSAAGPVRVTSGGVGAALHELAAEGITSLLVEGGPTLQRAMWTAGVVDRVQIIETSRRIGDGVPAFRPDAPPYAQRTRIGDDVLVEWDVHRTD